MIIYLLLGVFLVAAGWTVCYRMLWDRNVTVCLNFLQSYVYAGEKAVLTERIENRKKMPLPVLEVDFHLRKEMVFEGMENTNISDFTYRRDVFALLGNQRITRQLTLDCTKRGFYRIEQVNVKTFTLLYERSYKREELSDAAIYVYAKRTDVSGILLSCEKMMGTLQCAKQRFEDPFAFHTIREYTVMDPMKTINWKASAKTGSLMVNTFESTLMESVMIYLDLEDRGILKQEGLIEEGISVAASLAQRLLQKGMSVGICVNVKLEEGESACILPDHSRGQLTAIERLLAERTGNESRTAFVSLLHMHQEDSLPIVISKNDTENQKVIEEFFQKEGQGIWVLPFYKGEPGKAKLSGNGRLIKREVEER